MQTYKILKTYRSKQKYHHSSITPTPQSINTYFSKMKQLILLAAIVLPSAIIAQQSAASQYAATITTTDLQKHLTIVAGADMQGRETGTEGQRKAATYIETQFKALGLQPPAGLNGSYQQLYPLYRDSLTNATITIADSALRFGEQFSVPVTNNSTQTISAKQIVFVGYGISDKLYDDYAGKNVKGKIVLFFLGEPRQDGKYFISGSTQSSKWTFPGIAYKLQLAKEKGAVGAFIISPFSPFINSKLVEANRKTNLYYPRNIVGVNGATLSHDMARSLLTTTVFDALQEKANTSQFLNKEKIADIKTKIRFDCAKQRTQIDASNVIGVIEGTDKKEEYIFLTAHYDHLGMQGTKIFYGADDDGSGTVAIIQMAAAFAKAKAAGQGPRRTIVFMAVSGEEKGLWGSEYYSDNPLYPLDKTSVDLNTDMIGRIDPNRKVGDSMNYVYVIGHDKLSSDLPVINEGVNNLYTKMELDYKYDDPNDKDRIYYRSDHYNFARKGVPILFFFDGIHKDYHKTTDTVDKINWELYAKRTQLIFYTAWEMANRDAMLKRDIPLPTGTER